MPEITNEPCTCDGAVANRHFSGISEFSFPGSLGTASYRENRPNECYVQNRDLEAWKKYRGKMDPIDGHVQEVKP